MDGWMDGWMDNEKRMMVEGERELRRVSMTRLGCLVAYMYAKSGRVFKVRPKTRHSSRSPKFSEPAAAQSTLEVSLTFWSLYSVHGGEIALSNNPQRANIAPFSTGERQKWGRNNKYV